MNKITLFGIFILLTTSLSSCNGDDGDAGSISVIESCVIRGVAYFKEIGSYPTLSSGRSAEAVSRERCNRTTTAF